MKQRRSRLQLFFLSFLILDGTAINVSKGNIFTGFSLTIGEKSEKKNPNKFSSKVVPVGLDIRTAKGTAFIR